MKRKMVNIRLAEDINKTIKQLAEQHNRSTTKELDTILREMLFVRAKA